MKLLVALAIALIVSIGLSASDSAVLVNAPQVESKLSYARAKHGFNGGLTHMIDLSIMSGFDGVRSKDQLAQFAAEVPDAVGFTAHPGFEVEEKYRHAYAVVWYTRLSEPSESWPLYLFEESEANKAPGSKPQASAIAAAEIEVSQKIKEARKLIRRAGAKGVELRVDFEDYEERKRVALAVIQLGGVFRHFGEMTIDRCRSCSSVIPGGSSVKCGFGISRQPHWNCCGAPKEIKNCLYWHLVHAQDQQTN